MAREVREVEELTLGPESLRCLYLVTQVEKEQWTAAKGEQ